MDIKYITVQPVNGDKLILGKNFEIIVDLSHFNNVGTITKAGIVLKEGTNADWTLASIDNGVQKQIEVPDEQYGHSTWVSGIEPTDPSKPVKIIASTSLELCYKCTDTDRYGVAVNLRIVGTILEDLAGDESGIDDKYDVTHTFYVPDSIVPEFSFTLDDWNDMHAKYGVYPKFNTKITGTATGTYGASIVSVLWGCGIPGNPNAFFVMYSDAISSSINSLVTSTTTLLLKDHQYSHPIYAIVTDSRNRKKIFPVVNVYEDPQFVDYASPTLTKINAYRCNEDGTSNDNGAFGAVVFSATINHNIQGANIVYTIKKYSSEGTISTELTDLSNAKTVENYRAIVRLDSYNVNYILSIVINDGFTEKEIHRKIDSLQVFIELDKDSNSIGLGSVAEGENTLSIGLLPRFKDGCNIIEHAVLELPKTGWVNNTQRISSALTYRDDITLIASPILASYREYCENGIFLKRAFSYQDTTIDLLFICDSTPSEDLKVNILALYRF